jgi:DNA invertase Pin-like site-specific DNA recombinase
MLFQMLGVFEEFERALIQERIHAGLVRAREKGTRSGRPIGRPRISRRMIEQISAELAKGTRIIRTARLVGVGVGTVQKIKASLGLGAGMP